ncbi:ubiquitin family protein [Trichoderma gamsii]|uniref:Ubiquitin family protein n=1 Tax=Trichoderma gamsii TaxID=398673 RepID=A0A2P4ZFY6_9HYPO|nr:ubiquitin family protein [Trichoderma gamsii]PON23187.1 ubiquitin family protein [Trichoderma gamsii]
MASEHEMAQSPGSLALPDPPAVNLQVLSPSVGVNRPLMFPGLSSATTIKQLKEKIRQSLPLRPSDENQRLIYRGRALLHETDTLLDVIGSDVFRQPDLHTIHLVLRDVSDGVSPASTLLPGTQSPALGSQSSSNIQPPNIQRQTPPHPAFMGPPPPPGMARRPVMQPAHQNATLSQPQVPSSARPHSPSPIHTPEQAAAFQQQHQSMTQWLTQIQREAMARMVQQNQRGRAHMGMRGVGDPAAANHGGYTPESNSGRGSPAPSHTIYREVIGPNGHSYHVETRNVAGGLPGASASAPSIPGVFTPNDIHNILRGADSNQIPAPLANALHQSSLRRSASSASLHNRAFNQPSITTSVFANGGSRAGSGRATPDLGLRSVSGSFIPAPTSAPSLVPPQSRQGVDVYILSSPEGPRALVFNGNVAEAYYTPRLPMQPFPYYSPSLIRTMQPQTRDDHLQAQRPDARQAAQTPQDPAPQPQQQQQQVQQPQPPQQQGQQPRIAPLHAGNPPAAGLAHLIVQLAPHIWLIIRLALFVWFFTPVNSSWSRWCTVIALALFMFALTTGLLAGYAEQIWRPIMRYLENVLPAMDHGNHGQREDVNHDGAPRAGRNRMPDPAETAARLLAERRGQESWLTGQLRRLERAGLLFLASIAPGVAERHIANQEREAREQEVRRREAEIAARAAEAAMADAMADARAAVAAEYGEEEAVHGTIDSQQQPGEQDGQHDYEDVERDRAIREEISTA